MKSNPKSNKFWYLLLAALGVLSAITVGCLHARTPPGTVAVVTLDGKEVHRVDLSRVAGSYTLSYTGKSGITNVVEVRPGAIRVREADCPDRICVKQGWIQTGTVPIVCLPNSLIIEITGDSSNLDGISR